MHFFVYFDFFVDFLKMFASSSAVASVVATGPLGAPAPPSTGRELLEARLSATLMNANVKDSTLDTLGNAGLTSVVLFANLAETVEAFRAVLEKPEVDLKGDTFAGTLEQAKLVSVWKSLRTTTEVEAKAQAERTLLALPPQILPKDLASLKKIFEKTKGGWELAKHECPSKSYFERKIGEVETAFEAEHLTMVTNGDRDNPSEAANSGPDLAGWDMVAKTFRVSSKEIRVAMPKGPEGLRARLLTLGLAFVLLKLKFPSKGVLRTADMDLFHTYVRFLFGPNVWGKATLGIDGKPTSTPHLQHVLIYDAAIRSRVADHMNGGVDIQEAFREATANGDVKQTHFYGNVNMDIGSARCRAITAPGLATERVHSEGGKVSKALDDEDPETSTARNRAKRLKKKANKAAKAAKGAGNHDVKKKPKALAALTNGGVGDDRNKKGKGKGKLKSETDEGKSICFKYNQGKPCTNPGACPHLHVCRICQDTHPMGECPKFKKG